MVGSLRALSAVLTLAVGARRAELTSIGTAGGALKHRCPCTLADECKVLQANSKLGGRCARFPMERVEFDEWCELLEIFDGDERNQVHDLVLQGLGPRPALTHFNTEDIVCGCDSPCGWEAVTTGECPTPVLGSHAVTKHQAAITSHNRKNPPPPRPTLRATHAKASSNVWTKTSSRRGRRIAARRSPIESPAAASLGRGLQAAAASTPGPKEAMAPPVSVQKLAGLQKIVRRSSPKASPPPASSPPAAEVRPGATMTRAAEELAAAAAAAAPALWLSARVPRATLDTSNAAVQNRQLDARHRQDARSADPATLPGQLFAGTFDAAIELLQIGEEHGKACEGRLAPVMNRTTTHGLVASITMRCSNYAECTWAAPPWHGRSGGGSGGAAAKSRADGCLRWTSVRTSMRTVQCVSFYEAHLCVSLLRFSHVCYPGGTLGSETLKFPLAALSRPSDTRKGMTTTRTMRVHGRAPLSPPVSYTCTRP